VTLTSSAVAGVLEQDGILLHCDSRYAPIGVTAPLPRVIDATAYLHQAKQPKVLNRQVWNKLLIGKTTNQQAALRELGLSSAHLVRALKTGRIDEGNCARRYWQLFFPAIGWQGSSRDQTADNPPNLMLNYGYTVLATLCHRALLIHGLSPLLGVGHVPRYRADALVYDLMEPYRPFVDQMLAIFLAENEQSDMTTWGRHVGRELRDRRVSHKRYSLKLMDAIDKSASTLNRCYKERQVAPLWYPSLAG